MNRKQKLLLSAVAGLLAVMLSRSPAWWGVLFSPAADSLFCASAAEEADSGWRWERDGVVLRFRSLDILLSFLHSR